MNKKRTIESNPTVKEIRVLQHDLVDAWDTFVLNSTHSSIYHLSIWRNIISDLFGHDCYYLYAISGTTNIVGVLPLVRLKSMLFGDYMVSMPYFNYGGAIADSAYIEEALMKHAINLVNNTGVEHIEFRDTKPRNNVWKVRMDKVSMVLDLPESSDVLWRELGSKRRAQIKRPLQENVNIIVGSINLLDEFYNVFACNMRDLGTPVYAKEFFKEILNSFNETSHIVIIRLNNTAVSAAFLLGWRDRMEIPWASTLREANPLGINMLLYWEVLKLSIEKGYKYFDFGRCSIDSGTYRFKKQWGAEPHQHYWHYWLRSNDELPQLTVSDSKYQIAINIWKHLPVWLTKLIGPRIVKNLP